MADIINALLKDKLSSVSLKSIFTGFMAIIVALITMLSTGNTGKVAMRVVGNVDTNTTAIAVEISNYTFSTVKDEAGYSSYKLEIKDGESWKEVAILGANKDIVSGDIKPLESSTRVIELNIFGVPYLKAGDYRLTKTFLSGEAATAEFTVTEAVAQQAA